MAIAERRVFPEPASTGLTSLLARHRNDIDGYVFLAPFLAVYAVFLVFPFFKGIWISFHDWNLLAVAFDPGAKELVGFKNYTRIFWGRDLTWELGIGGFRLAALLCALIPWWFVLRGRMQLRTAGWISATALLLFAAMGIGPAEDGRWFDRRFWPTVGNTLVFVALTVPAVTGLGLAFAIALNRPTKMMATYRTIFFLSHVLSVSVVTLMWQFLFNPQRGLIAHLTTLLGFEPLTWLTNQFLAMPAIVITTVWWSVGFAMVIFLAGLQAIPHDRYEAARIDGAGPWAQFRHITLPGLRRTTILVVVLQTIAHFQVFGQAHIMTRGGPNDKTQTIVRYIYQTGFRDSELGRAAAVSLFLFAVMLVFSFAQLSLSKDED